MCNFGFRSRVKYSLLLCVYFFIYNLSDPVTRLYVNFDGYNQHLLGHFCVSLYNVFVFGFICEFEARIKKGAKSSERSRMYSRKMNLLFKFRLKFLKFWKSWPRNTHLKISVWTYILLGLKSVDSFYKFFEGCFERTFRNSLQLLKILGQVYFR